MSFDDILKVLNGGGTLALAVIVWWTLNKHAEAELARADRHNDALTGIERSLAVLIDRTGVKRAPTAPVDSGAADAA